MKLYRVWYHGSNLDAGESDFAECRANSAEDAIKWFRYNFYGYVEYAEEAEFSLLGND